MRKQDTASELYEHLYVELFVLVALVGELADLPQFLVHLLVQQRLDLGLQELDRALVDAFLIGLGARLLPVVPVPPVGQLGPPDLGLEAVVGVVVGQVVAAGTHLVHDVEGHRLVGDGDAAQDALGAVDDLVRGDQHLGAARQPLLDVAHVVDHVPADQASGGDVEGGLHQRLLVEDLGVGAAGRLVLGHAEPLGDVGVGRAEQRHLRRAVAVDGGLHIHVRHQATDDDLGARLAELAEDDAEEALGEGLHGGAGQGARRGGAGQGAGGVDEGDVVVAAEEKLLHHLFGVAQGRDRLDVEGERRGLLPLLLAAEADIGHLQLVLEALDVDGGDVDRLVGAFQHGQVLPAVVGADSGVLGNAQGHEEVDVGQGLGQLGEVLDVLVGSATALTIVGVEGEGGVGAGAVVDLVLVEIHHVLPLPVLVGGAGDDHPLGQRGARFVHHPGGDLDQTALFGGIFNDRTVGVRQLYPLLLVDANARLSQHPQGRVVDRLDLVLGKDLQGGRSVHLIIGLSYLHVLFSCSCAWRRAKAMGCIRHSHGIFFLARRLANIEILTDLAAGRDHHEVALEPTRHLVAVVAEQMGRLDQAPDVLVGAQPFFVAESPVLAVTGDLIRPCPVLPQLFLGPAHQHQPLVMLILLVHDPLGLIGAVLGRVLLVLLERIAAGLEPALGQVVRSRDGLELADVGLVGPQQQGDAVIGAGRQQRMLAGAQALEAVSAQPVPQNDEAGRLDGIDHLLQRDGHLGRHAVEAVVHEADLAGQVQWRQAFQFLLQHLARDDDDG
ncbi:MAG: hypothetical protein BAJATHORv1_180001 [Candidatus Thorarchaeota archaeon]|nr:MAG: hypothetical protein BAJATHORv1_180001 [Candidatus Thorarchaeota archaeon]